MSDWIPSVSIPTFPLSPIETTFMYKLCIFIFFNCSTLALKQTFCMLQDTCKRMFSKKITNTKHSHTGEAVEVLKVFALYFFYAIDYVYFLTTPKKASLSQISKIKLKK